MSLTLTGDQRIQELNAHYRDQDRPTDVLSFAFEEGFTAPPGMPRQLGDVIVSLETTYRQAEDHGSTPLAELAWVICHGTLHLLGYDHQDDEQRQRMRACEQNALEQVGLAAEVSLP
jgi:probable rRNA maturation factor